jgi:hypothetical protein
MNGTVRVSFEPFWLQTHKSHQLIGPIQLVRAFDKAGRKPARPKAIRPTFDPLALTMGPWSR